MYFWGVALDLDKYISLGRDVVLGNCLRLESSCIWVNTVQCPTEIRTLKINETAKERQHAVLQFLPYHCELNITVFVWAQVKYGTNINSATFKTADVTHLTVEGSANVRFVNLNNSIKHVRPTETKMMRVNEIQNNINPSSTNYGQPFIFW